MYVRTDYPGYIRNKEVAQYLQISNSPSVSLPTITFMYKKLKRYSLYTFQINYIQVYSYPNTAGEVSYKSVLFPRVFRMFDGIIILKILTNNFIL